MIKTKTTESTNKYLVSFDKNAFETALEQFKNFENIKVELEKALLKLGKEIEYEGGYEIDFFNPKITLENIVMSSFKKKNTLNLSFEKLVEILELPTKNVNYIISELEKCKVIQEPTAKEFSQYANTTEQKEKLRYANGLVRHLEAYRENSYGTTYGFTIIKGFTKPPIYISSEGKWHTNPHFVYDTFR